MGKSGLRRLYSWRPSARFGCLGVFVFCGIFTFCPIAYIFVGQMWEPPSLETRKQVDADLRSCTLKESELPNGWSKKLPMTLPPYGKPTPTGMLGGIIFPFSHQGSSAGMPAFHELQFYERTHRAVYLYRLRRIGFLSRWYRTWLPLDPSQANLSANEYRVKCSEFVPDRGSGQGDRICEAKARYGRFISVFSTGVSPWDMSTEEYIQLLQAIDRHMLQCVDSFAGKKWEEE